MPTSLVLPLAAASLGIWIYLIAARGGFWFAAERDEDLQRSEPRSWPAVVAVVPARNEAEVIEQSLSSLLAQDYLGPFSIVLVDDQSSDDTAAVAAKIARG